jgi:uroporphyrinogen-III synthase
MQNEEIQIQVAATRKIQAVLKKTALEKGVRIQDLDLLEINYLNSEGLRQTLQNNALPIVFTSAHAVAAFLQLEKDAGQKFPVRQAFAISGNTQKQALKAGFAILGAAPDARSLAPVIAASSAQKLLHLTAALRRVELYKTLTQQGIELTPVEVYEKTLVPAVFGEFDALMAFSPSQVDSFLVKNKLPKACPVFCIGKTTAARVAEIPHDNIIIAESPSESGVLQQLYKYYNY